MRKLAILCIVGVMLLERPREVRAEEVLSVNKTAFESFNLSVDFTQVIGNDGLSIVAVKSFLQPAGTETTSQIIATDPAPLVSPGTDVVVFRVQGGSKNQVHLVDVQVVDNVNGQQFEGQIRVTVTANP